MALSANREVDRYVDQELRSYPVAASTHVYKGAFVTLNASGYAEPLSAGDRFVGLAYEEADNSSGANADIRVRVFTLGDFGHTLTGATVADVGRAVYAGADNTLTFTPGGNTFVGYVKDWVTTNEIIVRLDTTAPTGTEFKFVCMADQALRLEPGAAGGIYIKGAKQADDLYVSVTDIGDFIHLIADGNGDWVAVASIGGADGDITVET